MEVIDAEARAESLQQMIDSDGWVYAQDFIERRIADHTNQLLTCKLDDVVKHRAKVEAFNAVLLFVKDAIEEGNSGQA